MARTYDGIDFKPPKTVGREAAKGLKLRERFGRGGTEVGVGRARQLEKGDPVPPNVVRRMSAYFKRHNVDKRGKNWGREDDPSAGYVAWLLWGGEPGRDWADRIKARMDKADGKA
ncbi:hypothetical protein [Marinivivus vitaminiproducens]|uniref:hypothetical protein n=1 Tax=Marinivivus vitaminiproducens TaxID=3035935 RepID=UPI0027A31893|nr:hypothetical protein P4R82_03180 [Geminicoccaceae bacterium SCSIO 64248]